MKKIKNIYFRKTLRSNLKFLKNYEKFVHENITQSRPSK